MPMTPSGTVSSCTAQGRRTYQEDRFVHAELEIKGRAYYLLAVLDGHGGEEVADKASKRILRYFSTYVRRSPDKRIPYVLSDVVRKLQKDFRSFWSGSTISLVCIPVPFTKAHIAVVGDSPVLVCTAMQRVLAPMHNVGTNQVELDRALVRGASFKREGPGVAYIGKQGEEWWIQLSRTIGDSPFGQLLDRRPSLLTVRLSRQSHILVASDGLWRSGEPKESWVSRMAGYLRNGEGAETFVADGIRNYGHDNATAIVWHQRS